MATDPAQLNEAHDFFNHPLCGFLLTTPAGKITRANQCIAQWVDSTPEALEGKRFSDLLNMGGKIYYETHLWPLLRMQGFFDEVAIELLGAQGAKKQVLINAFEHRDALNQPAFVQITILKAADRRKYEQNLKEEKVRAEKNLISEKLMSGMKEQFIAVLGHDLRNPLSSIITGTSMLLEETDLAHHKPIIQIIDRSAARMAELINNIMDFARVRMGNGITVFKRPTLLEPVLRQIVDEIAIAWPKRMIKAEFDVTSEINCDGHRIGQLCSNLLANALTHGSVASPVVVRAFNDATFFELSVSNSGIPIPPAALEQIFLPFKREEHKPSQQGLGLGLFIASEIARAHHGTLTVQSDETETRFIFRIETVEKNQLL